MSATLPHGKVLIEEALTGVVYPRKKRIAQTSVSKLSKFKNPFCDDYESNKQWINKDKGVERLREFIRFGYMTASESGARDSQAAAASILQSS
jgi:ribosomal protein S17E